MAIRFFIHCDRCGRTAKRAGKIDSASYKDCTQLYERLRTLGWMVKKPSEGGHCCPACLDLARLAKLPPARG